MPSLHVSGYDLAYAEAGSGEPLVMVHGTLGDQRSMAPIMDRLAERYRAIALSLRHCWPGRWEEGGDFTIDRHVADVAGFIAALGEGPVRLFGHSRGGHIAFRVAERHPQHVRALVLAEPGGELDASLGGAPMGAGRQAAAFAQAAALIAAGDIDGGLRHVAEHTGGTGAFERVPEARKQAMRDNARTLLGQVHENRAPYARASAEAIRAPTLLLHGADTQPNFVAIVEALARAMTRAERVVIPAATHSMIAEQPAAVAETVLAFFADETMRKVA